VALQNLTLYYDKAECTCCICILWIVSNCCEVMVTGVITGSVNLAAVFVYVT
jgi:hypothetical protein